MKEGIFHLLRGSFLTNQQAYKNWRFMIFLCLLASLIIFSGHRLDNKLVQIESLKEQVHGLKSEFVATRQQLQHYKLESRLRANLLVHGLKPAKYPPQKIIITKP